MATPLPSAAAPRAKEGDTSQALTVRLARIADWPWLRRVMPEVFPEIGPVYLSQLLRNQRHLLAVALDERGRHVGFCQMHRTLDPTVLWVNFIGVDPTVRRSGAGKVLLDWSENYASRLGCSRVELDVVTSNHGAIAFYDRLGYRRTHTLVDDLQREKFRYVMEVQPHVPPSATSDLVPSRPVRILQRLLYDTWFFLSR